ncbi:fibronectin type III domain-containing protein [Lapillicoccus jejuensis]|uniref:Fibronectin type III domain protein n=1 Tax=Lapillicoccus jejuensis TaxID=402171 RepID=A0A542E1I1_9MICO|nr:fibronectin type III domain-containing protein [Lapillicoccus jejuensis]TQJ09198.1 fibronectin type III domain protein [Lapillicoccus jejuensis]
MRAPLRLLAVSVAATLVGAAATAGAVADGSSGAVPNASRTWGTNGRVSALLSLGTTVVVGGDFTEVVDPSGHTFPAGHLAKYDTETGAFDTTWRPATDGSVLALAASGDTLFVGGTFLSLNGSTKAASFGAVSLATGATKTAFTGRINREVDTITVAGSSVFVGGLLTKVTDAAGAHTVTYAAKLDTTTGTMDTAWAPVLDKRVRSLLATPDGTKVYVGGDFTTVGGYGPAGKLTLLSTATAAVDPTFRGGTTNLTARAPAYALTLSGNALLVAATGSGGGCSRLDATTGQTVWSKHANGDVQSIAVFGPYTYCGGHFSGGASFDGLDRQKLAAVTTDGGVTQAFAPNVNSALGLWSMTSTPRAVVVGGDFTRVDSTITPFLTQFRDLDFRTTAPATTQVSAQAGDATVALTWDVPWTDGGYPTYSYVVYRSVGGGAWSVVGNPGQESFVDTRVTNGTTYAYAVVTRNAAGDSPFSPTVTATPQAAATTAPGVPTAFQAAGGLHVANLGWGAPTFDGGTPVTGYRILRGTSSGTETALVDVDATTRTYADTAVVDGTQYYYTVQALNAVGASVSTPEKTATPSSGVPSQPVLTRDTTTPPSVVTLTWTVADPGGSPITKYVVVRDGVRVGTVTAPTQTLTDPAPASGTHVYQVKALNSIGASRFSNGVTVTLP